MTNAGSENADKTPRIYALRFSPRAHAEVKVVHARFMELAGEVVADAWRDGLGEIVSVLATYPRRYVQVPGPRGARFRREVRRLVYRRPGSSKSSPAYLVLFAVEDDTPDGSLVTILTVRHAAQKPLTREEARVIEAGEEHPTHDPK